LIRQSLETAKIFAKDYQKSVNLMIGLFKHLCVKLQERSVGLAEDNYRIEEVCQRLETSTQKAEFKQVQLEGEL
jgi:hypothetical protein